MEGRQGADWLAWSTAPLVWQVRVATSLEQNVVGVAASSGELPTSRMKSWQWQPIPPTWSRTSWLWQRGQGNHQFDAIRRGCGSESRVPRACETTAWAWQQILGSHQLVAEPRRCRG